MNTTQINELFRNPGKIDPDNTDALRQLVNEYPWCSSFQVMFAKSLKLADDPGFGKQLKKTAVYAGDRKILYRLIMQPGLQQSIADFEALTAEEEITKTPDSEIAESDANNEKAVETDPTSIDEPVEEKDNEIDQSEEPVEEIEIGQSEETPAENVEEEELIDSTNLEREVLSEVAAHSYQRELEKSLSEEAERISKESPEKQVGAPKSDQPTSFLDFISGRKRSEAKPQPTTEEEDSLISRFIESEPKIERKASHFFSPVNMGKMSLVDNDEIVTETLAEIYAKQGDIDKARRAYDQLALKYPEKSLYFAGLIKKLDQSRNKK